MKFLLPMLSVLSVLAVLTAWGLVAAPAALAEYRAYELEIYDIYDCRLNKRVICRKTKLLTAMAPDFYQRTHGGPYHIGVLMLATWMCYGDTSFYDAVCPRPLPRKPRFSVGDSIKIKLDRHLTEGWLGNVEVAYYQESVRSNVYGIRFNDRRGVYLRYFEKDLSKAGTPKPQSVPPQ